MTKSSGSIHAIENSESDDSDIMEGDSNQFQGAKSIAGMDDSDESTPGSLSTSTSSTTVEPDNTHSSRGMDFAWKAQERNKSTARRI